MRRGRPYERLVPGGVISAREANRQMTDVEKLAGMQGTGYGHIFDRGGNLVMTDESPGRLWLQILSGSANPYVWQEVIPTQEYLNPAQPQNGTVFTWVNGERSGGNAYEVADSFAPAGTIVEALFSEDVGGYVFKLFAPPPAEGSSSSSSQVCVPIITDMCCNNGQLQFTQKFLYLPPGATISDTPCDGFVHCP
jgi:hypothetical protein